MATTTTTTKQRDRKRTAQENAEVSEIFLGNSARTGTSQKHNIYLRSLNIFMRLK